MTLAMPLNKGKASGLGEGVGEGRVPVLLHSAWAAVSLLVGPLCSSACETDRTRWGMSRPASAPSMGDVVIGSGGVECGDLGEIIQMGVVRM